MQFRHYFPFPYSCVFQYLHIIQRPAATKFFPRHFSITFTFKHISKYNCSITGQKRSAFYYSTSNQSVSLFVSNVRVQSAKIYLVQYLSGANLIQLNFMTSSHFHAVTYTCDCDSHALKFHRQKFFYQKTFDPVFRISFSFLIFSTDFSFNITVNPCK